ncbi:cleft lip and palate transmembrane protein 1 protein-like [Tropilaelaps mercedesae]|uniref:Cleft lip and palate transmembrane protein 1 protein-like n=1 Tax=Tropilaelaps mercedesae TaxID=418985 RepID=A0A1V9XGJ1_9ACAR|nr:cleft lip and palate transmembrane protein 1 protein-like [Tropilaelaps mercedesae]
MPPLFSQVLGPSSVSSCVPKLLKESSFFAMGFLPRNFSLGSVIAALFLAYICSSMYTMYKIYNPAECTSTDPKSCLQPAWRSKGDLRHQLVMVVATSEASSRILSGKHQVIFNNDDFDITQTTSDL